MSFCFLVKDYLSKSVESFIKLIKVLGLLGSSVGFDD